MEYRIEQLARAAGVAVDTIRFYQGKGLLDSPRREGRVTWYGEGHVERLKRIKELQQQGFTLTVIQRFLAGEIEAAGRKLLQTFNGLLEASGTLVRHHFERTLLRAAREHIEKRG